MATSNGVPLKPWEINRSASVGNLRSSSETSDARTPPPVPARPSQQRSSLYQPSYGGIGSMGYGGYGSSYGYGGYGMYGNGLYGSSGLYGGSYRAYGSSMPGGFTQQAEESTRQAFQSVESIVRAFTSVSTMLESTLGAVYSSFRAVLDVADHLSRVKTTFSDILSSIAVVRFLRFLYRRAMAVLRLRPYDEAWEGAGPSSSASGACGSQNQKKSWPIMLFVAVVLGGPCLIWKLLQGFNSSKSSTQSWVSGEGDHVIARVEYDFRAEGDEEISLQAGETIVLAPRELQPKIRGWIMGTRDGKTTGYLPANYVKVLGLRRGRNQHPPATAPAQRDPEPNFTKTFEKASSATPRLQQQPIAEEDWESIHGEAATSARN